MLRVRLAALRGLFARLCGWVPVVWLSCLLPQGALAEEEVRILIARAQAELKVEGAGLMVFDGDLGEAIVDDPKIKAVQVRLHKGLVQVESGGQKVSARKILIEAHKGLKILNRVYLGRLEMTAEKQLLVINRLPVETYLLGIVGSEMDPSWPLEALKAQAVAARSFALQRRMMMRAADKPFDLGATVLHQVYTGTERVQPSIVEAVRATRGRVLSYRHDLAEALFHSTCGGQTRDAKAVFGREVPYLTGTDCRWCRDSNRYNWSQTVSLKELSNKLKSATSFKGLVHRVDRAVDDAKVDVHAQSGRQQVSPQSVRAAVGYSTLFSDFFTAITRGKDVLFKGRGFGHGVGMCQWGARGMANAGKSYAEILLHYYPKASVRKIY